MSVATPSPNNVDGPFRQSGKIRGSFNSGISNLGPRYSLNFLNGVLDPSLTFSRASSATMYNSSGQLVYAPMNWLARSNAFTTGWVNSNMTVTPGVADPFGGNNATTFTATGGSAGNMYQFNGSTGPVISSIWVRRRTGTGAIQLVGAGFSGTLTIPVTSTWTRFAGPVSTGSQGCIVNIVTGGDAIDVYGAQTENYSIDSPHAYIATTGAAYNGPRFDYNPSTLALNGLLIEQQSTNLATYSNTFNNAIWTATSNTITQSGVTDPAGNAAAWLLQDISSAATFHQLTQGLTVTNAGTYTISLYALPNTLSWLFFDLFDGVSDHSAYFNLSGAGSIGTTSGTASQSITLLANGWYKITITSVMGGTAGQFAIGLANANGGRSYAGTGSGSIYIYGAQLENLAFPTSYIPTLAATATRALESLTNNNIGGWINASAGTFFSEWLTNEFASSPVSYGGVSGDTWNMSESGGLAQVWNNVNALATVNGISVGNVRKDGFAYTASTRTICLNGGAVATDSHVPWPSTPTAMTFGSYNAASQFMNGWLKSFSYYNTALSNAQLQTISGQL